MHGWKRLGCWADVVAGADDLGLNDAASIGDLDFAETRDRNRPTFASGSTQPLFDARAPRLRTTKTPARATRTARAGMVAAAITPRITSAGSQGSEKPVPSLREDVNTR